MYEKFILVKCEEDCLVFKEVFEDLFCNRMVYQAKDFGCVIYHSYQNNLDIENTILSLCNELMINAVGYCSMMHTNNLKEHQEEEIATSIIKDLPSGVYDFKKALLWTKDLSNKKQILNYIIQGSGIDENFILSFLKYDLNVSKASKEMFIHRNTMIYKLDKLKEVSGFDLRSFKDSFILYSLLEK